MRFKIDENLPGELKDVLAALGHEARTVFDQNLQGASDETLWPEVLRNQEVLLTIDKDFSDVRQYPPATHYGVIVFRLESYGRSWVIDKVREALVLLGDTEYKGKLFIVNEGGIRTRK